MDLAKFVSFPVARITGDVGSDAPFLFNGREWIDVSNFATATLEIWGTFEASYVQATAHYIDETPQAASVPLLVVAQSGTAGAPAQTIMNADGIYLIPLGVRFLRISMNGTSENLDVRAVLSLHAMPIAPMITR